MKKLNFPSLFSICIGFIGVLCFITSFNAPIFAQELLQEQIPDSNRLTLDRIIASGEFRQESAPGIEWINEGEYYLTSEPSETISGAEDIVKYNTSDNSKEIFVKADQLIPQTGTKPLDAASIQLSPDGKKLLIFTNTKKVWRKNTRGDYWVLDMTSNKLIQLGFDVDTVWLRTNHDPQANLISLPESSLMFAKFSPNSEYVAFVSKSNIYVQNISSNTLIQLTHDGSKDIINGTFDWAYEEEFGCQDGFQWSPDGNYIAFWQIDASTIPDFLMINNTDSNYSRTIEVEYPKAGVDPSKCRVGVAYAFGNNITWMKIPGDPQQNYIPKMQWVNHDYQKIGESVKPVGKKTNVIIVEGVNTKNPLLQDYKLIVQQLNRKQNEIKFWECDPINGNAKLIYSEEDYAYIELPNNDLFESADGKYVFFTSEKDGWNHIYKLSLDDQTEVNITPGNYDVVDIKGINEETSDVFFTASPENATQRYLHKVNYKTPGSLEKVTPYGYEGTNIYDISPNGKYAIHSFSNAKIPKTTDLITLPSHNIITSLVDNKKYKEKIASLNLPEFEFFKITTEDGVEMDGKILFPPAFDSTKKYPVLMYVYGEPGGQTALDRWEFDWHYLLSQMGYIIVTMDNRGTPAPKGREWRKNIYMNNGAIPARDQAMALKKISEWNFIDRERIAVWGWSGGGTTTLHLLFRYPDLFQTGMAVAPVTDLHLYDNIYTERYMGLPQENEWEYKECSAVTFAKNLKGNLLLVHGTGDDNVHYQNSEVLINELVRHNKKFQMMSYPNRTHSIREGANTTKHLYNLLLDYLVTHTPPGGK